MILIKPFAIVSIIISFVISSGCNSTNNTGQGSAGGGGGSSNNSVLGTGQQGLTAPLQVDLSAAPSVSGEPAVIEEGDAPLPPPPPVDPVQTTSIFDLLLPSAYATSPAPPAQPVTPPDPNQCRIFNSSQILNLIPANINTGVLSSILSAYQALGLQPHSNGSHVASSPLPFELQGLLKVKLALSHAVTQQLSLPVFYLAGTSHFFVCNGVVYFPKNFHGLETYKGFKIFNIGGNKLLLLGGMFLNGQPGRAAYIAQKVAPSPATPGFINHIGSYDNIVPLYSTSNSEVSFKGGKVTVALKNAITAIKNSLPQGSILRVLLTQIKPGSRYLVIGLFNQADHLKRLAFIPFADGLPSTIIVPFGQALSSSLEFTGNLPFTFTAPPPPPPYLPSAS